MVFPAALLKSAPPATVLSKNSRLFIVGHLLKFYRHHDLINKQNIDNMYAQ